MSETNKSIERVLARFEALSAIPRAPKHEAAVMAWIENWAGGHGFTCRRDEAGNRVVVIPASAGCETAPTVVLQAHVDMVCEKDPDSTHNFATDPIRPLRREGWLVTDGTTLGADNGLAAALMMTLAEDATQRHPSLELLFTVEEETGLVGAGKLESGLLSGRILLNLDSETEGELTIGCAGGMTSRIRVPLAREESWEGRQTFRLCVEGLRGGHSGVDIHLGRMNAIKVLSALVSDLQSEFELRLHDLKGGAADNAIPRTADAVISFAGEKAGGARARLHDLTNTMLAVHGAVDPGLRVSLETMDCDMPPMTAGDTGRVLGLINDLPHGIESMADAAAQLVRTSSNLASVKTGATELTIVSSQRSLYTADRDAITERIAAMARAYGASEVKPTRGYPAWEPNTDSPLARRFAGVYRAMRGEDPRVQVIHAGLECAVIGKRIGGMEMISYGPTIENPHSPAERAWIESIGFTYELTAALLEELARD